MRSHLQHLNRLAIAFVAGAAFLLPLHSAADPLPPPLAQVLKSNGIADKNIAYAVLPLEHNGAPLLHRAEQSMQPASTMKLLTTYAALELLGPAATWKTSWYGNAPVDGVLHGPLYLQGSGDPTLTVERFWLLLRQLRQRGVQRIEGDIVLDRSAYNLPPHDPAAFDNEPLRPYNSGPDALLVNFGAVRLDLLADAAGKRVRVLLMTPSERLQVDSSKLLASNEPCGDWRDKLTLEVRGNRIEVGGSYALACGDKTLNLAMNLSPANADTQVGDLLRALWRELGGSFTGEVRSAPLPPGTPLLLQGESPSLAEAVRDTNKFSNNVMARQLFLSLAEPAPGKPATLAAAQARLQNWLTTKGLRFTELRLDNGSGLSRDERISALHLAQLLADAWRSPVMPEYLASLPLAGADGTLKKRFENSPARLRAHLKTGSIAGVRALAGYVQDQRGRRYALACMVNDPHALTAACDSLADWLAGRD